MTGSELDDQGVHRGFGIESQRAERIRLSVTGPGRRMSGVGV